MHMADALLTPAVGGTMWAATATTIGYCSRKINMAVDEHRVPLMGVLGAFIFAAQMINFTIPATGSSGHIAGGMILAVLLGPYAGFLVMASVLTVQALFFADGGLLALGCNIFNLAFFPSFLAYPLLYKPIAGKAPSEKKILVGALLSSVAAAQLGSLAVVVQTVLSGVADLSPMTFLYLMQPIHLAIGLVEGVVTAAVVIFVWKARPQILQEEEPGRQQNSLSARKVLAGFLLLAVFTAGVLSWFVSSRPDGLEWSLAGTAPLETASADRPLHAALASLQERISLLTGFGLPQGNDPDSSRDAAVEGVSEQPRLKDMAGTSVSGLLGGAVTLALAAFVGLLLRNRGPAERIQR